jgi:pimeloyl-ACP methyl ester carboxylesterase
LFAAWTPRALDLYVAEGLADRRDGQVELKCPGEIEGVIFANGPNSDVMARASGLVPPALILWAARGNFPRAHFETLASRMPCGVVRDAGAGHLVPMEKPMLVAAEVLAFSARSAVRAGSSPPSPRAGTPRG